MSRFLDFLGRVFAIVPPPPRYAIVLLDGNLKVYGFLLRRWPRIVLLGTDGARFEVEPRGVRLVAFAPEGYVVPQETP